jgi:hypothetical protein
VAKPDTDDGWFKLSIELEVAVAYAAFTKVARVVLGYTFIQIYGRGIRPELAKLDRKTIAARTGQKRQNVSRAIEELVGSNVLVPAEGDMYRFAKDYETWVTWSRDGAKCGRPRLDPAEVADCKASPAFSDTFRVKGMVDTAYPIAFAKDAQTASIGMQDPHPSGCKTASIGMQDPHPSGCKTASIGMQVPIEERPRGINSEIKKREERVCEKGGAQKQDPQSRGDWEPEEEDEDEAIFSQLEAEHASTNPEARL